MSDLQLPGSLVDVDWLHNHLDDPQLVIFDGSWHMPATKRSAFEEWQHERIKNAQFFDFDQRVCAPDSDLPHMMPDAQKFSEEVQKLGLNEDSVVVIYDSLGVFTSPRVWWMLRSMGFENCAVLDGGLPAWHRAGYDIHSKADAAVPQRGNFVAKSVADKFCDANSVLAALDDDSIAVVDARPSPRFSGEAEEPRAGLRRGHMPGATNLPFADLIENGMLKSGEHLLMLIDEYFDLEKHTICSCGSGVTACVIAFGAHLTGNDNVSVYDGSWSEWGLPGKLPVVSDQAE